MHVIFALFLVAFMPHNWMFGDNGHRGGEGVGQGVSESLQQLQEQQHYRQLESQQQRTLNELEYMQDQLDRFMLYDRALRLDRRLREE